MVKHFRSKEAFRKNAAYVHIHHIPHKSQKKVEIDGRTYTIKHPHNPGLCMYCGKVHS